MGAAIVLSMHPYSLSLRQRIVDAYTLVYAILAVIEVKLFLTYVRRGADPFEEPVDPASKGEDAPLEFAY